MLITTILNDVCRLVTDGTHDTPKPVQKGFPLVKAKEIVGGCIDFDTCDQISKEDHLKVISRSKPEYGDILFAHIGASLGETAFIKTTREFSIKNIALFKPDPSKIDNSYLYYYVINSRFQNEIKSIKTGSAQPFVSLGTLRNHAIEIHKDLNTQHKIASILSAYDYLIENNTRRIKILEEMARMIYREWFVNFRFPGHEKVKMVNSPLGKIPVGWEVGRLQDYVELCYGKALKAEDRLNGPYPVYGSSGIVGRHSESLVDGPGIIVGRKGNVGSVHWTDEPFFPIDTVYYVKSDVSLYYVYYNLQQQNFINNDAAVPGLNRNQAYALPFLVPLKPQLMAFDEFIGPIFKAVRTLTKKNQNLRQTRDLLLPKLISGDVEV